jgi:hypothetical protein
LAEGFNVSFVVAVEPKRDSWMKSRSASHGSGESRSVGVIVRRECRSFQGIGPDSTNHRRTSTPPPTLDDVIEFDGDIVAATHELYLGTLGPIDFADGFTALISETVDQHGILDDQPPLLRPYVDAYIDLHRLLEEIRFEVALASLLIEDRRVKLERGDLTQPAAPPLPAPMPMEALALLQRYMREPPAPPELFADPYAEISGSRVLGDWFAAQLLDSALFRSVAACDRLAILLWVRGGRQIATTKRGRERHPAFTPRYLNALARDYGDQPEWPPLRALADDELFTFTKELRDGFTHSRRLVSELHGERVVAYAMEAPMRGVDADEHRALALAFYDVILRPAIGLSGAILGNRPPAAAGEAVTQ